MVLYKKQLEQVWRLKISVPTRIIPVMPEADELPLSLSWERSCAAFSVDSSGRVASKRGSQLTRRGLV